MAKSVNTITVYAPNNPNLPQTASQQKSFMNLLEQNFGEQNPDGTISASNIIEDAISATIGSLFAVGGAAAKLAVIENAELVAAQGLSDSASGTIINLSSSNTPTASELGLGVAVGAGAIFGLAIAPALSVPAAVVLGGILNYTANKLVITLYEFLTQTTQTPDANDQDGLYIGTSSYDLPASSGPVIDNNTIMQDISNALQNISSPSDYLGQGLTPLDFVAPPSSTLDDFLSTVSTQAANDIDNGVPLDPQNNNFNISAVNGDGTEINTGFNSSNEEQNQYFYGNDGIQTNRVTPIYDPDGDIDYQIQDLSASGEVVETNDVIVGQPENGISTITVSNVNGVVFNGDISDTSSPAILIAGDNQTQNMIDGLNDVLIANNSSVLDGSGQSFYLVLGENASINADGGAVYVNDDASGNVAGSNIIITDDSTALVGVFGNNDILTDSVDDAMVSFTGIGDTGNISDTTVYLGTDTFINVSGPDDTVNVAVGDSMAAIGGNNIINAASEDEIYIEATGGIADTINVSGDQFGSTSADDKASGIFLTDDSQANLSGSDNDISLGTGDSVGVYGGGDNTVIGATGSDDVWVGGNTSATDDTVNATDDSDITITTGDAIVDGGGNIVILQAASDVVTLNGTDGNWDSVTASDATVIADQSVDTNVTGGGNNITTTDTGDDFHLFDTDGNWDSVTASDATVIADQSVDTNVIGGGNNITTTDTGDDFHLFDTDGNWDTVAASNATVIADQAVDTNLSGDDNSVNLDAGDTVSLGGSDVDTFYGSNVTINGNAGDTIVVDGNNDTIDVSGATIEDYGNDDITYGSSDSIEVDSGGIGDTAIGDSDSDPDDPGGGTTSYGTYYAYAPGSPGYSGNPGQGDAVAVKSARTAQSAWSVEVIAQYDQTQGVDIAAKGATAVNGDSGNSTVTFTNPTKGVAQSAYVYSGEDGTGTLEGEFDNLTNGTSILYNYPLSGNISETISVYSGLNQTGTITSQTEDFTDGTSQEHQFTSSGDLSEVSFTFSQTNATGSVSSALIDASGGGSVQADFGTSSTVPISLKTYSEPEASGVQETDLINNANGTSALTQYDSSSGAPIAIYLFSELNGAGPLLQITYPASEGNSEVDTFSSDGSEVGATDYLAGQATSIAITSGHLAPGTAAVTSLQAGAASALQQVIQAIASFSESQEPPAALSLVGQPNTTEAPQLAAAHT